MIFSSWTYIAFFLPLVIILYWSMARSYYLKELNVNIINYFLIIASIIFYSWQNFDNFYLILTSITVNYIISKFLLSSNFLTLRKYIFILGTIFNLGLLFYYKYTNFSISIANYMFASSFPLLDIVLPIGISFFTFQQIAYLVDVYDNKLEGSASFNTYAIFVTFFPQLIAGPIVHHSEMMPQFADPDRKKLDWDNMWLGLAIFTIGLAKKMILAENLAPCVKITFDTLPSLTFCDALVGSLSYTLQLYFDFSGYCDMAIGTALFFNINLPINFDQPYIARNIQDFWRRWHITLSRWLKEYLYIPLGGNRGTLAKTLRNVCIVFVLGGIWHGAYWTFALWGALHGMAHVIYRLWKEFICLRLPLLVAWLITFAFVNFTWVPFRATSLERINIFLDGFMFKNGFLFSDTFIQQLNLKMIGLLPIYNWLYPYLIFLSLSLIISLLLPNVEKLKLSNPSKLLQIFIISLIFVSLYKMIIPDNIQEFLYFRF